MNTLNPSSVVSDWADRAARRPRWTPATGGSWFLLAWAIILAAGGTAAGQGPAATRSVPREEYYLSFQPYYDGDYLTAGRGFRNAARSGVSSTAGRWVDSICYYTMMGECYYHVGELALALEQYEAALKLYLPQHEWMLRVKFPPTIRESASSRVRTINWAQPQRKVMIGQFPDTMVSLQGNLDPNQVLQQGGVVANPNFYPLNVTEIVRCLALSLRRRTELMGPTCAESPLTAQLVTTLSRKPVPPGHWSVAWANLHLALAYLAAGRTNEATSELNSSLLVAGQFDHPLTATALLELGKLSLQQENHDAAGNYFIEATLSAAAFGDYDVMREAFEGAYLAYHTSGKQGVLAPLPRATEWARRNSRMLEASLELLMAENLSATGEALLAAASLEKARRAMVRRDMLSGDLGARLQYLTALVSYQTGKVPQGNTALAAALQYLRKGSHWQFQIALADNLYTSNAVTDRVATSLYDGLLREPSPADWSLWPMETLSVVSSPNLSAMEHWFEVAVVRKEFDRAIEISDRIRRSRFYTTLPLGGRLLALRWVLEAPPEMLTQDARLQRQNLLIKYPRYAELSKQAQALRDQLRQLPITAAQGEDAALRKQQESLFNELDRASVQQETILREIALRREPSDFVFPPSRTFKQSQERVGDNEIVLTFFFTSRDAFAFAYSKASADVHSWKLDPPNGLKRQVATLLKQIGQVEKNQAVRSADLQDESWKTTARALFEQLTGNIKAEAWNKFDQLVVVPDGVLWYLPFEALQLTQGEHTVPLISKARIRTVPTIALAHPQPRGRLADAEAVAVWGELFPKADQAVSAAALQRMRELMPQLAVVSDQFSIPCGLFKTRCDRLLVMRDLDEKPRGAYDWSPMQYDRGKPGSALATWFELPWGGPRQVILPGFHTPAEEALKRGGTGSELFLLACGMMAGGTDTVLVSRWRVGGQTSQNLVREFVQELPHTTAADAWQRSVEIVSAERINADVEPRVKLDAGAVDALSGQHPFFWSGYLLIDTGSAPK